MTNHYIEDEQSNEPKETTLESKGAESKNTHIEPPNERRLSGRLRQLPKHLLDYQVDLPPSVTPILPNGSSGNSVIYPLSNYLSYKNFSNSHSAYLTDISSQDEPKTFMQAVKHQHWREAMKREIEALEKNDTWSLTHLPSGKNTVDSKWIYKVKFKPNGEVERYKASGKVIHTN